MRYEHFAMIAALIALTAASCKKDAEERAPTVTILSPYAGSDIQVPDTLLVVADVSGENGVDQVQVSVTNADGIPVTTPISVVPGSNPARIEVLIPLVSDLIASGDHTVTVKATSGDASAKDYRSIDVFGSPLRLRQVLVIGEPDAGTVTIHRIDSTGAVSLLNTLISDLGGAAVSSYAQTFSISGAIQGPLISFKPDGQQVAWQKPNLGTDGIQWFNSLDPGGDNRIYAGTSDGVLRGYNARTGTPEFTASVTGGYRTRCVRRVNDLVVVAENDGVGGSFRLDLFQASSGALVEHQTLDKSVAGIFRRDDDHVLIFGDRDGQGVVEDRSLSGGGGWEPRVWGSPITAIEQIDANTFLVALQDGSLERFTYSNAGSLLIASIADIRDLSLDPVSGLIYAASGNEVIAIDPMNGNTVFSFPFPEPIRYVLPLLNR